MATDALGSRQIESLQDAVPLLDGPSTSQLHPLHLSPVGSIYDCCLNSCEVTRLCNTTLLPPPLCDRHKLWTYLSGIETGDAMLDEISLPDLLTVVHPPGITSKTSPNLHSHDCPVVSARQKLKEPVVKAKATETDLYTSIRAHELMIPSWVDPATVARAQRTYRENAFMFNIALTKALNTGFCISRFSEVLVRSGYALNPRATLRRFHETATEIIVWMSSDLLCPNSPARRSVFKVRCLHAAARKMSLRFWKCDTEGGNVGIPLSQFDMALVQLAFSGVMMDVLNNDVGLSMSDSQKADNVHMWRFLGYLLGIEDDYNACRSVDECTVLSSELLHLTPIYLGAHRPACLALAKSFYQGLSQVIGSRMAYAVNFQTNRDWYEDSWASSFITQSPSAYSFHAFMTSSLSLCKYTLGFSLFYTGINTAFYHYIHSRTPLRLYSPSGPRQWIQLIALRSFFVTFGFAHDVIFGLLDLIVHIARLFQGQSRILRLGLAVLPFLLLARRSSTPLVNLHTLIRRQMRTVRK